MITQSHIDTFISIIPAPYRSGVARAAKLGQEAQQLSRDAWQTDGSAWNSARKAFKEAQRLSVPSSETDYTPVGAEASSEGAQAIRAYEMWQLAIRTLFYHSEAGENGRWDIVVDRLAAAEDAVQCATERGLSNKAGQIMSNDAAIKALEAAGLGGLVDAADLAKPHWTMR
jgi:hypothetical protein